MDSRPDQLLIHLSCPDRAGLLAAVTEAVARVGGNLLEVHQYTEPQSGWFFTRLAIDAQSLQIPAADFLKGFDQLARSLNARWVSRSTRTIPRVAIFVSKQDHCLLDLLWRRQRGDMQFDVPFVLSNHEALASVVEREGVPFFHIPVGAGDRELAFTKMDEVCSERGIDLIVLARYMQILPPWFCERHAGRVINIHHSFLPAFAGAAPYRRAFDRGVKLIGATCHYATSELDEGPIIEQEVERVHHQHGEEDLVRIGRDCERIALARGVRYHLDLRVFIHGRKTIVFPD